MNKLFDAVLAVDEETKEYNPVSSDSFSAGYMAASHNITEALKADLATVNSTIVKLKSVLSDAREEAGDNIGCYGNYISDIVGKAEAIVAELEQEIALKPTEEQKTGLK
jgi:hypothetical protein